MRSPETFPLTETARRRALARRRNPVERVLLDLGVLPPVGADFRPPPGAEPFPVRGDVIFDAFRRGRFRWTGRDWRPGE